MPISEQEWLLSDVRYAKAVEMFNAELWYAAHDLFEELWHESFGRIRELLQGIIQVSVAEYHLENGNTRGSILLMAEGLQHLERSEILEAECGLNSLRDVVRSRLSCLQNQLEPNPLQKPSLFVPTNVNSPAMEDYTVNADIIR